MVSRGLSRPSRHPFAVWGSSLESKKWHSVCAERYVLMFVRFFVFFVILLNCRSVRTERYFLMAKRGRYSKVPFHFGGHFGDLWACFWESFFHVFLEGTFFGTWANFGHPRCPIGSEMELEWSQNGV